MAWGACTSSRLLRPLRPAKKPAGMAWFRTWRHTDGSDSVPNGGQRTGFLTRSRRVITSVNGSQRTIGWATSKSLLPVASMKTRLDANKHESAAALLTRPVHALALLLFGIFAVAAFVVLLGSSRASALGIPTPAVLPSGVGGTVSSTLSPVVSSSGGVAAPATVPSSPSSPAAAPPTSGTASTPSPVTVGTPTTTPAAQATPITTSTVATASAVAPGLGTATQAAGAVTGVTPAAGAVTAPVTTQGAGAVRSSAVQGAGAVTGPVTSKVATASAVAPTIGTATQGASAVPGVTPAAGAVTGPVTIARCATDPGTVTGSGQPGPRAGDP